MVERKQLSFGGVDQVLRRTVQVGMFVYSDEMSVTDDFNHCMNVNIIKSSYFVR